MAAEDQTDKGSDAGTEALHGEGHAQELQRSNGKFCNFGISFSIIFLLSGRINSFLQAISGAGGADICWIIA